MRYHARKETEMVRPEEVQAALALEERAKRVTRAALADEKFLKDLREAQALEAAGVRGEPWAEVKARLGLV
jgi:hypothetical protein